MDSHPSRPLTPFVLLLSALFATAASAGDRIEKDAAGREYFADQVVIKVRDVLSPPGAAAQGRSGGSESLRDLLARQKVLRIETVPGLSRRAARAALGPSSGTATAASATDALTGETLVVDLGQHGDVAGAIAELAANPEVEYAEPLFAYRLDFVPNDPELAQQWYLSNAGQYGLADVDIDAPEAWDVNQGIATPVGGGAPFNPTVAVIDTGLDFTHPDLVNKVRVNPVETLGDLNGDGRPGVAGFDDDGDGLIDEDSQGRQPGQGGYNNDLVNDDDENGYADDFRGWNFVAGNNNAQDDNGHGTHVAGIVGAQTDNAIGTAGVCPLCRIMPLRAFNFSGVGTSTNIAAAIRYAAANGAQVINMSFTGAASSTLQSAITQALPTAVLVAAAGNDGTTSPGNLNYPAAYEEVTGVGASDVTFNAGTSAYEPSVAPFSNLASADVFAPGVNIRSSFVGGGSISWSGTSMASPVVAGIAALMVAQNPPGTVTSNGTFGPSLYRGQLRNALQGFNANALVAVTTSPVPALELQGVTVSGGNGDAVADAGESPNLTLAIKNTWGNATGVVATVSSSDPYVTVVDGNASIGAISSQQTGQNGADPIVLQISASAPNNQEITIRVQATSANGGNTIDEDVKIRVRRGIVLSGGIATNTTLLADTEYVVTGNLAIAQGVTLTIQPGATIRVAGTAQILTDGAIIAEGTSARPITFTTSSPVGTNWAGIKYGGNAPNTVLDGSGNYVSGPLFRHVIFEYMGNGGLAFGGGKTILIEDCLFRHNIGGSPMVTASGTSGSIIRRTVFDGRDRIGNSFSTSIGGNARFESSTFSGLLDDGDLITPTRLRNSLVAFNMVTGDASLGAAVYYNPAFTSPAEFTGNCFIENSAFSSSSLSSATYLGHRNLRFDNASSGTVTSLPGHYWGTTSSTAAKAAILDFDDGILTGRIDVDPILTESSASCPAHLKDVVLSTPSPLGPGPVTFTLTFNRAMDQTIEPIVSFARLGYDPPVIASSRSVIDIANTAKTPLVGGWTSPTTWQAEYDVTFFTGDGTHTLIVSDAKGLDGMVIPIDTRFTFDVATGGLEGVNLQASGEAGRVRLTFQPVDEPTLTGYKAEWSTSPTGPFTQLQNPPAQSTQIFDTSAPEGVLRHYRIRAVRTDFSESEPSTVASAAALDGTGPTVTHTPVTSVAITAPGVTIQCNASDVSGIGSVRLFYRIAGQPTYQQITMTNPSGSLYSANIPQAAITFAGIDYYLEARDALGNLRSVGTAAGAQRINVTGCTTNAQCNDGNPCTNDVCSSGTCSNGNNTASCNDGNACTQVDVCQGGACLGTSPKTCVASSQCHAAGTCNPASGACSDPLAPDGTPCSDGTFCNGADQCSGGGCSIHAGNPCIGGGECSNQCNEALANCASPGVACSSDGNPCTIDTCNASGACGHVAGNAGVTCRVAAGLCDVAEACDGVSTSCPVDTGSLDTDGEGICDALDNCRLTANLDQLDGDEDGIGDVCDLCNSRSKIFKAKLKMSTFDAITGDDKITLSGQFKLSGPTIDPVGNGAHVLVTDASGDALVDFLIPAVVYSTETGTGWKVSRGTSWSFTNSSPAAPLGILKVTMKTKLARDLSTWVYFKLTSKAGSFAGLPVDAPFRLRFRADAARTDQCGEISATATLPDPAWSCAQKGSTYQCR